jgi:glycosyltransferase involved in cell wall biosynthesis
MSEDGERTVAVVIHESVHGAATRSVTQMVPLLERRGWSFVFWVPRPSALFDELSESGFAVWGAPAQIEYSASAWRLPPGARARLAGIPPYLRGFSSFLGEGSPDLVHANSIHTSAEALVARAQGRAVLLHVHEMLRPGLMGAMLRSAAWRLHEVVAVSLASAIPLAHRGAWPRIVYESAPVPEKPVPVRENPRPFVVGTAGAVSTHNGTDIFIEAARRVLARSDAFRFEMVGPPFESPESGQARQLLEHAAEVGVEHRPAADVLECGKRWDAFVLPARRDPFPIAMLEAMASGLPVIGAGRDGLAEQIEDGCGVLVEPESPDALAEAIVGLADKPAKARRAMGRAARERVGGHFNLERQVDAMHDAYLCALARAADGRDAASGPR